MPSGWALKPSGLNDGDKFRLLFVTSTGRDATATDIATYNTFVQTAAKAGHSAISDSCGNLFKVVGSTATVDARDNAGITGTGFPMYWLGGAQVADDYADFLDGNWDNPAGRNENGSVQAAFFFSGSNDDGTAHTGLELGSTATHIRGGSATAAFGSTGGLVVEINLGKGSNSRYLAISPVFLVGTSTSTPVIGLRHERDHRRLESGREVRVEPQHRRDAFRRDHGDPECALFGRGGADGDT